MWRRRLFAAALAAGFLWAGGQDVEYARSAPPAAASSAEPRFPYPRTITLARTYPDLVRLTIRRDGRFTWNRFQPRARTRWFRTHPQQVRNFRVRVARWEESIHPRDLGRKIAVEEYGLSLSEFNMIDEIWTQESDGWKRVYNYGGSGACHIPQALPCSKIPGGINATNRVAIEWGINYMLGRYGSISSALSHKRSKGWY